jgi:hypothetical protein
VSEYETFSEDRRGFPRGEWPLARAWAKMCEHCGALVPEEGEARHVDFHTRLGSEWRPN